MYPSNMLNLKGRLELKGLSLDYVRGHMGGNTISLFLGEQFTSGRELEEALVALDECHVPSDEGALIYPSMKERTLTIRIVSPTSKQFISACGGMTQVLGKALIESDLFDRFDLPLSDNPLNLQLDLEGGTQEIEILRDKDKVSRTITKMDSFAGELYTSGMEGMEILGVLVFRIGKFLVINAEEIKKVFPKIDPGSMNGYSREVLFDIQKEARGIDPGIGLDYALYDWNPANKGNLRAVFPHYIPTDHIEPSCGTGTVAIGLCLAFNGELKEHFPESGVESAEIELDFEVGGARTLGGPEISNLTFVMNKNRLRNISFSHDVVELTSRGKVFI